MAKEVWVDPIRAAFRERGWRKLPGDEHCVKQLDEQVQAKVACYAAYHAASRQLFANLSFTRRDVSELLSEWSDGPSEVTPLILLIPLDALARDLGVSRWEPSVAGGADLGALARIIADFADHQGLEWVREFSPLHRAVKRLGRVYQEPPYQNLDLHQYVAALHLLGETELAEQTLARVLGDARARSSFTAWEPTQRLAEAMAAALGREPIEQIDPGPLEDPGGPCVWTGTHLVAVRLAERGEEEVARWLMVDADDIDRERVSIAIGRASETAQTPSGSSISHTLAVVLGAIYVREGVARAPKLKRRSPARGRELELLGDDPEITRSGDRPYADDDVDEAALQEWRRLYPG